MSSFVEKPGELIDFTKFPPGTKHPERGFPIELCPVCGKPGAVRHFEDETSEFTHYAIQGDNHISSTDEEVCRTASSISNQTSLVND